MGYTRVLEKVWMEELWKGSCETCVTHLTSQGERGPVRKLFPLKEVG
jgi:hypothetical protein